MAVYIQLGSVSEVEYCRRVVSMLTSGRSAWSMWCARC